ncbi:Carboxysome shell and ethanolamine utilization microcompartment protein CcmL/EutN [Pilibacter termitis]|uniref:Carboxysome shell and ethanolamine utilization microcompartment protein CcmL/EutN n=1 Tax=Pilibacter termitis TaxID=263852 RepID=A0A1T4K651_9ENTE|nr:BMC domain-containing protein [Pilibacter termitis]SJZ37920.1 Carboxysome shell and ethanolamine utilization microcompartment protein CcmL/EutN [Pilibacter termitis]
METALGMVEVRGFLAAVAVTDAMLKSADVHLQSSEKTKGGLTTVVVRGDVGAIRAAIDAGVEIAKQLNGYLSHHVIARVDSQTDTLLTKKQQEKEKTIETIERNEVKMEQGEEHSEENFSEEELNKMKVVDLRSLAYAINLPNLTKKEIKFANKELLVRSILNYKKEEGK